MCIIYTDHRTRTSKILIHIPRTGGKAWRRSLKADPLVSIHRELWGVSSGKDQAHIPAMHISKYVDNVGSYEIHAVLRDPYQRLLSAFNMKFARFGAKPADFKHFVKNVLPAMKLDGQTNAAIIHFVPQVHFVTGTNLDINLHQFDTTHDKVLTSWYDFEAVATVDRIYRKDFDFIASAFNVVYSQAISDDPDTQLSLPESWATMATCELLQTFRTTLQAGGKHSERRREDVFEDGHEKGNNGSNAKRSAETVASRQKCPAARQFEYRLNELASDHVFEC